MPVGDTGLVDAEVDAEPTENTVFITEVKSVLYTQSLISEPGESRPLAGASVIGESFAAAGGKVLFKSALLIALNTIFRFMPPLTASSSSVIGVKNGVTVSGSAGIRIGCIGATTTISAKISSGTMPWADALTVSVRR